MNNKYWNRLVLRYIKENGGFTVMWKRQPGIREALARLKKAGKVKYNTAALFHNAEIIK